jgi:dTDP-4-amino-4,6-dideoxygalactose transaminase
VTTLPVPQVDLLAGTRALQPEIEAAIARVLASGWYILGAELRAFEAEFAAWLGRAHAIGCGNGTDALALALRSIGAGPGMTVVTVSHTAVATVAAVEMTGAAALLLDIEPDYYTMDPAELAEVLQHPPPGLPPVGAVVVVHLYGQMADMDAITALCNHHGVLLIEDCAQAHGARLHGRAAGTLGRLSTFSFYPTKNLGALGDAGLVATDDPVLAQNIAAARQYGWRQGQIADAPGINSRLDEMQAAILRAKLPHLDRANARRGEIARAYDAAFSGTRVRPPARRLGATHVFHQYVVRTPDRAATQARLQEAGIGTGVHYKVPAHLQSAYLGRVALGPAGCQASARTADEVMSLPVFPELADAQVERVCEALKKAVLF